MNRLVRLQLSRWYQGFWLAWFTGFGIFDLITHQWPWAAGMAVMMAVNVMLWMWIDHNVRRNNAHKL